MPLTTDHQNVSQPRARRGPRARHVLLCLAGAFLALPQAASAQFTSSLAPPPRDPTPAEQQVIAAEQARQDTVIMRERLDLRAWVDSAAMAIERGESPVAPVPTTPGDTLQPTLPAGTPPPAIQPTPVGRPAPPPSRTTVFREGAPAPATATPLPLLLLVAGGLMAAGGYLRRRR